MELPSRPKTGITKIMPLTAQKSTKEHGGTANCHHSNLNGLYHAGAHSTFADGVNWHSWKGYNEALTKTEMKFRPIV